MKKILIVFVLLFATINYCQLKELPKYEPQTRGMNYYKITRSEVKSFIDASVNLSVRNSFISIQEIQKNNLSGETIFEKLKPSGVIKKLSFDKRHKMSYTSSSNSKSIFTRESINFSPRTKTKY